MPWHRISSPHRISLHNGLGCAFIACCIFLIFVVLPVRFVSEAFNALGLSQLQGLIVFMAMLIWRKNSIPIYTSKRLVPQVRMPEMNRFFCSFSRCSIQAEHTGELVEQRIFVSIGGALIPLALSVYFALSLADWSLAWPWFLSVSAFLAVGSFATSTPWQGIGVRAHAVFVLFLTLLVAYFVREQQSAPQIVYMGTVCGILCGTGVAPLLFTKMRSRIDAPQFVIGGTGVFWSLFWACLVAGFLA